MLKSFCVSFLHLFDNIFLLPIRKYLYNIVQNPTYNKKSPNYNQYIKLRVVPNRLIILAIIKKPISISIFCINRRRFFLLPPISLFDILYQWGHTLTKGLSDPTNPSPSSPTATISSRVYYKKEKIEENSKD